MLTLTIPPGLTITLPMLWWMGSQWTWAFGIRQDKKTTTDSAHFPTPRRYSEAAWQQCVATPTIILLRCAALSCIHICALYTQKGLFLFIQMRKYKWNKNTTPWCNANTFLRRKWLILVLTALYLSPGCVSHMLLARESCLLWKRPCQGEFM